MYFSRVPQVVASTLHNGQALSQDYDLTSTKTLQISFVMLDRCYLFYVSRFLLFLYRLFYYVFLLTLEPLWSRDWRCYEKDSMEGESGFCLAEETRRDNMRVEGSDENYITA